VDRITGVGTDFFELTGEPETGGVSHRLAENICWYANRLSFRDLERHFERVRGSLPRQTLHRVVERVATDISEQAAAEIVASTDQPLPPLKEEVDVYDPDAEELLVMEDGILVKAQKPHRGTEEKPPYKRINTDVAVLELPDGRFHYITESIDNEGENVFTVDQALRAAFIRHWGTAACLLAVVAITDGARSIRAHLAAVFGEAVVIILDWYHLTQKLQVLLSQVCHGNAHRKQVQKTMEKLLWRGDVQGALAVLAEVKPRKPDKAEELREYLTRHAVEIIDYERRQEAGKPIGSGRVEKSVDQTVGNRQKRKGMSWSPTGSRALAHLKCVECNDEWDDFWARRAAA
jgi:hypothetical protein